MKKIRLILSAVLMMTAFSFIACSHSASGASGSGGSSNTSGNGSSNSSNNTSTGNNSKYQVGDIVLNDGSFLRDVTSVSDADKAKAIAVIYKVDGNKAYGVDLFHRKWGLAWCLESANGYNTNFTDLQCTVSGSAGNLSFTGDTDGSDNFTKMAQALGTNNDTGTAGNYPAFEFAKNFASQTGSHVSGTSYANGWYLPALSELFDIWKVKDTVDAKSNLCGGFQFGSSWYWSSSQYASDDSNAYLLDFINGGWKRDNKVLKNSVCCIRAFN